LQLENDVDDDVADGSDAEGDIATDANAPQVTVRGMIIGSLVGGVVGAQNIYFAFKV